MRREMGLVGGGVEEEEGGAEQRANPTMISLILH